MDVMFDALIEFVELKLDLCRTGNTTNTFRSIPKNTYCGRLLIAIKIVQKTDHGAIIMAAWTVRYDSRPSKIRTKLRAGSKNKVIIGITRFIEGMKRSF